MLYKISATLHGTNTACLAFNNAPIVHQKFTNMCFISRLPSLIHEFGHGSPLIYTFPSFFNLVGKKLLNFSKCCESVAKMASPVYERENCVAALLTRFGVVNS